MPSTHTPLQGRPYGGVAFLLRNNIACRTSHYPINSNRMIGIVLKLHEYDMLLVNVYFPVNCPANYEQIDSCIDTLAQVCVDFDGVVVVGGDFNLSVNSSKFRDLKQFSDDHKMSFVDINQLPSDTFTFSCTGSGHKSWIDHIMVPSHIERKCKVSCSIDHSPSDHVPLFLSIDANMSNIPLSPSPARVLAKNISAINWSKLPKHLLEYYRHTSEEKLLQVIHTTQICCEKICMNPAHHHYIEYFCDRIILALRESELETVEKSVKCKKKFEKKIICGWNNLVKSSYLEYRSCFAQWNAAGKPRDFYLHDQLKRAKREFRIRLKKARRDKERLLSDKLAMSYNGKDFYQFWKSVKDECADGLPNVLSSEVDGAVGEEMISEMWASHFKETFTSNADESRKFSVLSSLKSMRASNVTVETPAIVDIISKLKNKKARGPDKLCSESLKFCGASINQALKLLFESCLVHSFVPRVIMQVEIVPILKKKGLDLNLSKNYRPIALASVISKIFEGVILARNMDKLHTSFNQFGYKKNVGTEMAIFSLRSVAHHYLRNSSSVFVCYLDATKAFDLVNHWKLLEKLIDRGVDRESLAVLHYWFRNQYFCIRWGQSLSSYFPVRNGTRQGGRLSSYLFAVYMDGLSEKLNSSNVGCRIGSVVTNHICYADDICILATSIIALNMLLKICENYASQHDIIFNPSKTICQAFADKSFGDIKNEVRLYDKTITWAPVVKYLGYDVSCWDRDQVELKKRRRELYVRASLVSSRFSKCSDYVKKYLFQTYFGNVYCMSQWAPESENEINNVRVAYNDSFRILFGYTRMNSASRMFAENRMRDFRAVQRTAAYSLLKRVSCSENLIIRAIFNSNAFSQCKIVRNWSTLLFGPNVNIHTFIEPTLSCGISLVVPPLSA